MINPESEHKKIRTAIGWAKENLRSAFLVALVLTGGIIFVSFLAQIGINLASSSTAEAAPPRFEDRFVVEKVVVLKDGNTIVLQSEPVPSSVKVGVGPFNFYAKEEFGFSLEGRSIRIHPGMLERVNLRLPAGGVTVEYMKAQ